MANYGVRNASEVREPTAEEIAGFESLALHRRDAHWPHDEVFWLGSLAVVLQCSRRSIYMIGMRGGGADDALLLCRAHMES